MIEVQFHTDASFDAKMSTHEPYEQARLPGVDPATAARLDQGMNEIFAAVPRPRDAAAITWPDSPFGGRVHPTDTLESKRGGGNE